MSIEVVRSLPGVEINNTRKVKEARKNRLLNNAVLSSRMGHPDMLVYPAGRWDVENITMPSVKTLAMIDIVPLLFSEPRPENGYSTMINAQLDAHRGSYVALPNLFDNPFMSPSLATQFVQNIQHRAFLNQVGYVASNFGYEPASQKEIAQVRNDSLAEVLAGVIFWGADVDSIRLGKFEDDFRVQFDLAGQEKTIIFHQTRIDKSFSNPTSAEYEWTQRLLTEFSPRRTALLVKADLYRVSPHVMAAVRPDVVVGNCSVTDDIAFTFGDQYHFAESDSEPYPYPGQRWNGRFIGNLRFGERLVGVSR